MGDRHNLKILLVEDSRLEALYIEKTLGQAPPPLHKIKKAQTVSKAVSLLEEHEFDVVLLDLGLPDSVGFSGLQAILNVAPKVPVVILTGLEDTETELSAMDYGAQDYLLKNRASVSALTRSMRHAIQRKQIENIKSEFISIVSHELRTPLTSIHGSLGLITGAMTDEVPEKILRLINIAHKNSERLILLINDILDIEKIDSGQMYFEMADEPLAPLIEHAVETNMAYAARFNVNIEVEPIPADLTVHVDPSRLIQVMANFLSNAAKYSHPGQSIRVSATSDGEKVRLSVQDFGIGIRAESQSELFNKFTQADSVITRKKGGAGLGLYVSKQIVEHMGGRIGFTSEYGQGSTFWCDIPIYSHDAGFFMERRAS
jgi:signal transduction histidine kinase